MSASKVVPIRSLARTIPQLVDEIPDIAKDVPFDGEVPGFMAAAETTEELRRIVPLLQEVRRVLGAARDSETPQFEYYFRQIEARETMR
jgi:hypothetical protein